MRLLVARQIGRGGVRFAALAANVAARSGARARRRNLFVYARRDAFAMLQTAATRARVSVRRVVAPLRSAVAHEECLVRVRNRFTRRFTGQSDGSR